MVLKSKTYDVGSSESDDSSDQIISSSKPIKPQKEMVFQIDEDDSDDN